MVTHLEPDILNCEVKWTLGSITMNKASGGDGIPAELLQILKYAAVKKKAMANQDSILKSRDITLLTKVQIVKAIVFPVVMYGCESWTIK